MGTIRFLFTAAMLLAGCSETVTRAENPHILAMGDSLLAWHRAEGKSISDAVERKLGQSVIDRSTIGARFNYILPITGSLGLNISKQYIPGNWDWVILNGGGNDLWFGCGCIACDDTIDRLISEDGRTGNIPKTIKRIRATGTRIIFVGYLHNPGQFSVIDHCRDEGIKFEERVAKIAAEGDGVYYLKLSDMVPMGDLSYHSIDRIHPSVKATAAIGNLIAGIIQNEN